MSPKSLVPIWHLALYIIIMLLFTIFPHNQLTLRKDYSRWYEWVWFNLLKALKSRAEVFLKKKKFYLQIATLAYAEELQVALCDIMSNRFWTCLIVSDNCINHFFKQYIWCYIPPTGSVSVVEPRLILVRLRETESEGWVFCVGPGFSEIDSLVDRFNSTNDSISSIKESTDIHGLIWPQRCARCCHRILLIQYLWKAIKY